MSEAMQKIGSIVHEARKKKGVTLWEMATALNISPTYVNRVEKGEKVFGFELLYAVSEYLGVSVEELIVKDPVTLTPDIESHINPCTRALMKLLGSNVREARKKKGITLIEMGNALDISPLDLCRIENGERIMKAEYLYTFSEYLGVTAEYLVLNNPISENATPTEANPNEVKTKESLKLIGETISRARIRKEITQRELSQILDMPCSYIARIEQGGIEISPEHLQALSEVLEIPVETLTIKE